jgi:large subunit ribosomal protein L25
MPSFIEVDITELQLGKSIQVEELLNDQYDILNSPLVSVVSVNVPRVKIEIEEDEEEGAEGEGAEGEGTEGKSDTTSAEGENKDSSEAKEG